MRLKIKILVLREFYIVRGKKDFVSVFSSVPVGLEVTARGHALSSGTKIQRTFLRSKI
ncbi:hypothetical protein HY2_15490 [Hyphomonas pacifica]|nr:hypothetical protein HY2_15490 [Hyphomonas pacifica]